MRNYVLHFAKVINILHFCKYFLHQYYVLMTIIYGFMLH